MDAALNPFGAHLATGSQLFGREPAVIALRAVAAAADQRTAYPDCLVTGLRGIGKTALLHAAAALADKRGMGTVYLNCHAATLLLSGLMHELQSLWLVRASAERMPEDHIALLDALANRYSAVLICADNVHRCDGRQLGHFWQVVGIARRRGASIQVILSALPAGTTHARPRLAAPFEMIPMELGPLSETAAAQLLINTAGSAGLKFESNALLALLKVAAGHPLTLQQLGTSAWLLAENSPVRLAVAERAIVHAQLQLDAGFNRWRWPQLSPQEKRYLHDMAALGAGPHRSGDIATQMRRRVTEVAPTRSALIARELLYSPRYGETAFTTPGYAGFLTRLGQQQ